MARLTVPGYAHHIIQRGNNRQAIFTTARLRAAARPAARARAQAAGGDPRYVLMSNHFHLLATPETVEGIPQMMQAVGRATCATTTCGSSAPARCGRAATVDPDPDRALPAGLHGVHRPESRCAPDGGRSGRLPLVQPSALHRPRHDKLVTPHPCTGNWATRPSPATSRMPTWSAPALAEAQQRALTDSALRGWALGEPDYVAELQRRTERRVAKGQPGRPFSKKV
jgi:putative transposase